MFKLLKYTAIGAGTFYGYKKLTEHETNITVLDTNVKSCLFGKVDRHVVTTDKGEYVIQNKVKSFDFGPIFKLNSFEYGPISTLEKGYTYHVTVYGLDYPKLHLYRTVVFVNGSPCTSENHCGEKPSIVSRVLEKFY